MYYYEYALLLLKSNNYIIEENTIINFKIADLNPIK